MAARRSPPAPVITWFRSISGTAVLPKNYEYGVVAPGIIVNAEFQPTEGIGPSLWSNRHTDAAGKVQKEIRPGADGSALETQYFYNDRGLLSKVVRPGLADELTFYDELGRKTKHGLDLNGDHELTAGSTDRFQEFEVSYQTNVNGSTALFEVQTTKTYTKDGDGSQSLTSQQVRQLGNPTMSTLTVVNPDGSEETTTTSVDRDTQTTTQVHTSSRATNDARSISVNGLLISQSSHEVPQPVHFQYDALGRRTAVIDPLNHLVQSTTYDSAGRISTTTDALSHTTQYFYYSAGQANAGRLRTITPPAGTTQNIHYAYDQQGHTTHQWGPGTYPVRYEFSAITGQMTAMHTYRAESDFADSGNDGTIPSGFVLVGDITQWLYHPRTGQLEEKKDAAGKSTRYSYHPQTGQVQKRTWARKDGTSDLTTTYSYNSAGDLTGINYSDSTPNVAYTRDRCGRVLSVTDAAGTHTLSYTGPAESFSGEVFSGSGPLAGLGASYSFDAQSRMASVSALQDSAEVAQTTFEYEAATSRLSSVTKSGFTATYSYRPANGQIESVSYSGGGASLTGQRVWDLAGNLNSIAWTTAEVTVDSLSYVLDAAGRRVEAHRPGGDGWGYSYNARGEVVGSARTRADGSAQPASEWGYAYDAIGNRIVATSRSLEAHALVTTSYDTDATNAYTQRTVEQPARKIVRGLAHPDATVTVKTYAPGSTTPEQTLTAQRQNAEFAAEPTVGTANDQAWRNVSVEASRTGVGKDGQTVTARPARTARSLFPTRHGDAGAR